MARSCIAFVCASLLLIACGSGQRHHERTTRFGIANELREQVLDDRPKLVVIERTGDGATAIAFAARTSEAPIANYGLSLIIQRRLGKAGVSVEANPNGFGVSFVTLVRSPKEVVVATEALHSALSHEIGIGDFDRQFVGAVTEQFGPGIADAPGDIAIARCSGEIHRDARQSAALTDGATLMRWLESARQQVFSENQATFAIVGLPELAATMHSSLLALPPWPPNESEASEHQHVTPKAGITVSRSREWALSIAWRSGSFGATVSGWRTLRAPDSPLIAQLAVLDSAWRVDSISAVASPVGGCLRIDVSDPEGSSSKSSLEAGQVARLLLNESRLALSQGDVRNPPELPELFGSDPRMTARRAAWRALSVDQPELPSSYHLSVHAPTGHESDVEQSLRHALVEKRRAIEMRSKHEPGQPEQWMLIASTCGTAAESTQNSGATAAWLRALARKYSGIQSAVLEPWISEDGMGLFAHIKIPASPADREAFKLRLADTLGRVVSTGKISGPDLAFTRQELLVRVGVQPRRAWDLLLNTVSAHKPSLFEPLGTADSIRHLNPSDLTSSRRRWVREPLRVAFTTSEGASSGGVDASITRWLDPHRIGEHACESLSESSLPDSETQVLTFSPDERDASAYIAYHLRKIAGTPPAYDRWLEWLLNRPGGWLERTVIEPGHARTATAFVRGPRGRRVLFIEINSVDDSAATEAIARIRTLLANVAQSGGTAAEIDLASRWAQARSIDSALDPRYRLVRLWLGDSTSRPSRAGFPLFLSKVLAAAPVTTMRVRK